MRAGRLGARRLARRRPARACAHARAVRRHARSGITPVSYSNWYSAAATCGSSRCSRSMRASSSFASSTLPLVMCSSSSARSQVAVDSPADLRLLARFVDQRQRRVGIAFGRDQALIGVGRRNAVGERRPAHGFARESQQWPPGRRPGSTRRYSSTRSSSDTALDLQPRHAHQRQAADRLDRRARSAPAAAGSGCGAARRSNRHRDPCCCLAPESARSPCSGMRSSGSPAASCGVLPRERGLRQRRPALDDRRAALFGDQSAADVGRRIARQVPAPIERLLGRRNGADRLFLRSTRRARRRRFP